MKRISAKNAKNGFGRLLDTARAEPVVIEKHGRPVIVVLAIEEYERLKELDQGVRVPTHSPDDKVRSGRKSKLGDTV